MPNTATPHLLATQRPDGGWAAYAGGAARTEATALATLALARSSDAIAEDAVASGRAWLREAQLRDGSWPLGEGGTESNWSTSLAVLALGSLEPGSVHVTAGIEWLVSQRGRGTPWWGRVLSVFLRDRRAVELDPDLTGWPWAEGTFSWVEPTAYALLALKRHRAEGGRAIAARIEEGERMLLDRVCRGGGWNYGNSLVYDEVLWPYPDTTALALLALADRREAPEVRESVDRLPQLIEENDSLLSLGLGALALSAYGREAGTIRATLETRLTEWRAGELRALAWAGLGVLDDPDALGVGDG